MEAFDVCAFDYIVKPVSRERLERTIDRAGRKARRADKPAIQEVIKRLSIYCLGSLDIRSDRDGTVKWRSTKSEELFLYLLMHRGSSVSKDQILEDLFRGMPIKNAEMYLNTAVYQLRKTLATHGLKTGAVGCAMERYWLRLEEIYVDFMDFEKRVADLPDNDHSNYEFVYETDQLYSGDFLGEKAYLWSLTVKEKLSGLYADFAKKFGRSLLENGLFTQAVRILKKLVGWNELDEEANGLLLQVYAAMKERHSFMAHYDRFSQILREELGVEPAEEVMRLYEEMRSYMRTRTEQDGK